MKTTLSPLALAGLFLMVGLVTPVLAQTDTSANGAAKSQTTPDLQDIKSDPVAPVTATGPVLPPKPEDKPPVYDKIWHVTPPPEVVANHKTPASVGDETSPLGLPRLKAPSPSAEAPVPVGKYDVDDLTAPKGSGLAKRSEDGLVWLEVPSSKTWSRPLRGASKDVVYVSYVLNAGTGTVIKIGGAWLRVEPGVVPGRARVSIGRPGKATVAWEPVKYDMALGDFGAVQLALLPLLTVRLDPVAGLWDLYSGSVLIAEDCPMVDGGQNGERKLEIEAGPGGVWVCGVVIADENPLFEDANRNGLPDDFERAKGRALLLPNASAEERHAVVKAWQVFDPYTPSPVFRFPRPLPDRPLVGPALPE